jgi:CCR4-NOT transcription complex subunit 7/8
VSRLGLIPLPPSPFPLSPQDTEFPGVVARPVGSFSSQTDYHYQTLRCNVDMLKMIQLGVTFADEAGNVADGCPTFQVRGKWRRRRRRRGRRSGRREG